VPDTKSGVTGPDRVCTPTSIKFLEGETSTVSVLEQHNKEIQMDELAQLDTIISEAKTNGAHRLPKGNPEVGTYYNGKVSKNIKLVKNSLLNRLELQFSIAIQGTDENPFDGGFVSYGVEFTPTAEARLTQIIKRDGTGVTRKDGSAFTYIQSLGLSLGATLGFSSAEIANILNAADGQVDAVTAMGADAFKGVRIDSVVAAWPTTQVSVKLGKGKKNYYVAEISAK
jgi:hypothetical protein